ncbi:hypothetical protein NP493_944g02014 [Ridgeia piscesae]|uniref:Uncharacterized protein n=1 Tax=Ridgeia piscesae TaxID=27915 RepID=A0AAD9NJU2_RIDPI|nr:hypothetical protein NP493_944g02014 [Ridgeia piscesae]
MVTGSDDGTAALRISHACLIETSRSPERSDSAIETGRRGFGQCRLESAARHVRVAGVPAKSAAGTRQTPSRADGGGKPDGRAPREDMIVVGLLSRLADSRSATWLRREDNLVKPCVSVIAETAPCGSEAARLTDAATPGRASQTTASIREVNDVSQLLDANRLADGFSRTQSLYPVKWHSVEACRVSSLAEYRHGFLQTTASGAQLMRTGDG